MRDRQETRRGVRPLALMLLAALAATALGCAPPTGPAEAATSGDTDPAAATTSGGRLAADLVLTNARIYTLDPAQPWADALAIGGDRILAVGTTEAIAGRYQGEVLDLDGQMVLPGFHDAHSHPIAGGVQALQCDLSTAASVAGTLAMIQDCHRTTPDTGVAENEWLLGGGWNLGLFPDANPHKRLLDDITGERPVFLRGADGHSGWANSAALQRAGVTADTPNPPLGVIERDVRGEPTGTLGSSEAAGGIVVGGSDWSVSSMNPLDAIEVAVTRQYPDGQVEGVLNAAEAVSLHTMLAAYTSQAAYLMHQEQNTGTVTAGKFADLVVLDRNLFEIAPAAINEARVTRTFFAGRQVFPRAANPPAGGD